MSFPRGPSALMSEIVTALQADATLNDYVFAQTASALKYFIGVNDLAQPAAANIPMIALRPGVPTPAQNKTGRQNGCFFSIVISKDSSTTSGALVTMDGLAILEQIYFRFEAVIIEYFKAKGYERTGQIIDPNTEISYPVFACRGEIRAEEDFN